MTGTLLFVLIGILLTGSIVSYISPVFGEEQIAQKSLEYSVQARFY